MDEEIKKEEVSNDEIVIRGKSFKKEEVLEKGKWLAHHKTNKLRWTGAAFLSAGTTFILLGLVSLPDTTSLVVIGGILFILGLIFFLTSFKKRDPMKFGQRYFERSMPAPVSQVTVKGQPAGKAPITVLSGRQIQLTRKPLTMVIVDNEKPAIQIYTERRYSKIYEKKDIICYELRVDNELVITSNTRSKKGMGKTIALGAIGGALFNTAGAGMMAGSIGASQKTSSTQSQKEVHHFNLIIKVKDIEKASYYLSFEDAKIAEEVITVLDFVIGHDQVNEEPEAIEVKEAPKEEKIDKFAEIKKYKELLDAGIITQEEFDQKKGELL